MSVVTDVQKRLVAALGPDIPVLLPEQFRGPLEAAPLDGQGRPMVGGGERGLSAYLRQHERGYVQLYDLSMGFTLGGWADNDPLQIDTIATTREQAFALANQVRDLLASSPRKGGRRDTTTAPFVSSAATGSVCVTQRFNVRSAYFKGARP